MRKVISNKGDEFYIKFGRGSMYIKIKLYRKRKKKLFNKFTTYKRIGEIDIFGTYQKRLRDVSLSTIKNLTNKAIDDYYAYHDNGVDYDEWDGYLGNDNDGRKKEIMRPKNKRPSRW